MEKFRFLAKADDFGQFYIAPYSSSGGGSRGSGGGGGGGGGAGPPISTVMQPGGEMIPP